VQYFNKRGIYSKYVKKEIWNKGTKGVVKKVKSSWKKGQEPWNKGLKNIHLSPSTEFKKGRIPWDKGKECLSIKGSKHFASKSILRFNSKMELIKEYVSFTEAVNEGFTRGCLRRACSKYLGTYKDNYWCLKEDYEKREDK